MGRLLEITIDERLYSGTSLLRGSTFADSELRGSKNIQKLKISNNIKLKLEITLKDELQKTGFKA